MNEACDGRACVGWTSTGFIGLDSLLPGGENADELSSLAGSMLLPFFKNTVLRVFDSIDFTITKKLVLPGWISSHNPKFQLRQIRDDNSVFHFNFLFEADHIGRR